MYTEKYLKQYYRGLRNDSAVKCTGCSFRRPGFYPHGGSKTFLTQCLLLASTGAACKQCIHKHAGKILTQ